MQSLSIRVLGIPVGLYCATDIGSPFHSFFLTLFVLDGLARGVYVYRCSGLDLLWIGIYWLFLFLVVVAQDVSR